MPIIYEKNNIIVEAHEGTWSGDLIAMEQHHQDKYKSSTCCPAMNHDVARDVANTILDYLDNIVSMKVMLLK